MLDFVPRSAKQTVKNKIAESFGGYVSVLKYRPEALGQHSFAIPKRAQPSEEGEADGLPVPPRQLWMGYGNEFGAKGKEWYISKGKRDVDRMLELVTASGFTLSPGNRILEMGCAAGRMLRHLKSSAGSCETWGVDIDATSVNWCKLNLSPPFHFATTTTIPHLPFADCYFDFIYTGSVFTHIDDLTEAWLLELRRVLSPNGRFYLTIHDRSTITMLNNGYYYDRTGYFTERDRKETELTSRLNSDPTYIGEKDDFGMLVIGRDYRSQVFYDIEYFRKMVSACLYDVVSVTEGAYGHQTGVVLKRQT